MEIISVLFFFILNYLIFYIFTNNFLEIGQMKMEDEFPLCDVDMVNKVLSDLELEKAMDFSFSSTASELCSFGGFTNDTFAMLSCDDHMANVKRLSFEEEIFGGSTCTSGSVSGSSSSFANDRGCLGSLISSSANSSFESCNSSQGLAANSNGRNSYLSATSTSTSTSVSVSASTLRNTTSLSSLVAPVRLSTPKKARSKSVTILHF